MFYKGFHTDTSLTVGVDVDERKKRFIETGKKALVEAIKKAKPGNRIYDISQSIESIILKAGYNPVRALVGHGVGKELHEEPQIPCFTSGKYSDSPLIEEGAVIAIEVMYTIGSPNLVLDEDGWTISTADGKIAGLFEDTIAITNRGPKVLT
jgi:methionyl aminopeptidase